MYFEISINQEKVSKSISFVPIEVLGQVYLAILKVIKHTPVSVNP